MSTTEGRTSGAGGMAAQQMPGLEGSEVREGYAEIGDVRLHYVEAGEGPLVVLLHGFPEPGTDQGLGRRCWSPWPGGRDRPG